MIYHHRDRPGQSNRQTWNIDKTGKCKLSPFSLIALAIILLFSQFALEHSATAGSLKTKAPKYSTLYDQLLLLEQKEDFVEALRIVPKIYAAEDIPVEAFYGTLEKKRRQLLDVVVEREIPFAIGHQKLSCPATRALFDNRYVAKLERFRFFANGANDLEHARFCYLLIVEGHKLKSSFGISVGNPSSPWINLQPALDNGDPWLVSAALFVARKQDKPTISLQAVIDRWQRRPDLWDEQSTRQAMAFFARYDAKTHRRLQISSEDIKMSFDGLQPVPIDQSYLSPVLYSEQITNISDMNLSGYSLVTLKVNPEKKGVIKRWAGDANQFSNLEEASKKRLDDSDFKNGVIAVKPGWYQIRFSSLKGTPPSGYYGKSIVIEAKKGELVFVPVMVFPAI